MINVGIVGLGFMGTFHLKNYMKNKKSRVVAVCDLNKKRINGQDIVSGNIENNNEERINFSEFKQYTEINGIIKDKDINVIDVCLPSDISAEVAIKAMKSGKNVLCEKPMANTVKDGKKMLNTAKKEKIIFMIAHCIRFWPEYVYLKDIIENRNLGKLQSLFLSRHTSYPTYSYENWLLNEKRSNGAVVNLHIHDVDYIVSLFGKPKRISSQGNYEKTKGYSNIITQYFYDDIPVVVAAGGWMMPAGFDFNMSFNAIFEKGALVYDFSKVEKLIEYSDGKKTIIDNISKEDGYSKEIDYFLDCVQHGKQPEYCMPESSLCSLELVLNEINQLKK